MKALREVTLDEFREAFARPAPGRGVTMDAVRQMQMIQAALGFGVLGFGAVVVAMTLGKGGTPPIVGAMGFVDTLSLVNSVYFVTSGVVGAVVSRAMFSGSALNRPCEDAAGECVSLIRKDTIVRLALRESSAFFGLVVCLIAFQKGAPPVYWLNALPALAHVGIVVVTFPTQQRFENMFRERIQQAASIGGLA